jgi:hypothetical protein
MHKRNAAEQDAGMAEGGIGLAGLKGHVKTSDSFLKTSFSCPRLFSKKRTEGGLAMLGTQPPDPTPLRSDGFDGKVKMLPKSLLDFTESSPAQQFCYFVDIVHLYCRSTT